MESTPALEQLVREQAARLERAYDRIERCDVVVDRPHQSQLHGQGFRVRVTVAIPGDDVIASRSPQDDVYFAIRDTFRAARRQLDEHAQRLQSTHADAQTAR